MKPNKISGFVRESYGTALKRLEDAREDRELVARLDKEPLKVVEAAVGASIKQAKVVGAALQQDDSRIFLAISALTDERQSAAQKIWEQVEEVLKCNEHAVALVPRLAETLQHHGIGTDQSDDFAIAFGVGQELQAIEPSTTTTPPCPLPHSKMLPRLRGDKKLLFPVSLRVFSRS